MVKENNCMGIVQIPVPGIAYFYFTYAKGQAIHPDTQLFPVLFDDCKELFTDLADPVNNDGTNVGDKIFSFREAGRALEIISTTNELKWQGSIRAFKLNIRAATASSDTSQASSVPLQITGGESINGNSQPQFVAPSNKGCYMVAGRNNVDFETREIIERWKYPNSGQTGVHFIFNALVSGIGDLETNVMLLEDMIGTDGKPANSFMIRAWAVTEYIPATNTTLAKTARQSPPHDPVAMAAYMRILKEMPVAVTYEENGKFWDTVLKFLKGGLKLGTNLPGPYGVLSGSLGGVVEGIESIFN
jgi:hypothetical protein